MSDAQLAHANRRRLRQSEFVELLLARINAVRAMHSRKSPDGLPDYCRECLATEDPCPTVRALAADPSP